MEVMNLTVCLIIFIIMVIIDTIVGGRNEGT